MVSIKDLTSGQVSHARFTGSANRVLQKFEKRDPRGHQKKNAQRKEQGHDLFGHML